MLLDRLPQPTLAALRAWLRHNEVHILHFMGHGFFDAAQDQGSVAFETDSGAAANVTAAELATILHDHAALRLVFLNACQGAAGGSQQSFAGVAQKLVQQGVPAILAMQFPVSDQSAIALAHEFYRALVAGLPLESATGEARKAMYSEGEPYEWGTPVLFSRSPDGLLLAAHANQERETEKPMADDRPPKKWWEALAANDQGLTGLGSLDAAGAGGDVIIGIVGAGASDVAVGKNIRQQIYKIVGAPTPDDKQLITQKLAEVDAALASQASAVEAAKMQMAQSYLELLRGELLKTGEGETPSAGAITLVGNWLLDNIPEIAEALTGLFATPAVGRVVGKAGEAAVTWVKQRFS
jgi:hypothetical protein